MFTVNAINLKLDIHHPPNHQKGSTSLGSPFIKKQKHKKDKTVLEVILHTVFLKTKVFFQPNTAAGSEYFLPCGNLQVGMSLFCEYLQI